MTLSPALCPACLRENRVATVKGPTCPHQPNAGANWWPAGWATMGEVERVKWLNGKDAA